MVPQRIEVDADRVTFIWEDDTVTTHSARELRAGCACAACREPSGEQATQAVLSGDEPITIQDARLVGGYAIAFTFGPDGHGTGIYPFVGLSSDASS